MGEQRPKEPIGFDPERGARGTSCASGQEARKGGVERDCGEEKKAGWGDGGVMTARGRRTRRGPQGHLRTCGGGTRKSGRSKWGGDAGGGLGEKHGRM